MNKITIVILTYNRPADLDKTLKSVFKHEDECISEVIVVDNNSDIETSDILSTYPSVKTIKLKKNLGAVARNHGIFAAQNNIVICLDDDVHPYLPKDLSCILNCLEQNKNVAAITFKVLASNKQLELYAWCHPRDAETDSDNIFYSDYLSEGACAIRKDVFEQVGGYWEKLFIGHEGADLAMRILDKGYDLVYYPKVEVIHYHSSVERPSWRVFYYNHRNNLWIIWKNYRFINILPAMIYASSYMLFFSIRSFNFLAYLRAWIDALFELPNILRVRQPIQHATKKKIDKYRSKKPHIVKRLLHHLQHKVF